MIYNARRLPILYFQAGNDGRRLSSDDLSNSRDHRYKSRDHRYKSRDRHGTSHHDRQQQRSTYQHEKSSNQPAINILLSFFIAHLIYL